MGSGLSSCLVDNDTIKPQQSEYKKAILQHRENLSKSVGQNNQVQDTHQNFAVKLSSDGKYLDKDFPPIQQSLIKDWGNYNQDDCKDWDKFQWKRLSEIEEVNKDGKISVFQDQVTPNDIQQGGLGDCYYLSSLSVLAEKESRVKKIFEHDQAIPEGIYAVNFTKNGQKVQVVIDDHIPVDQDGQIVFSRALGNEIWVILMEKAWAKIHGSYEIIIAGDGASTLRDITGAPSFNYDTTEDETWQRIQNAQNNDYIIVSSTKQENKDIDYDKLGLVSGHEYAILQCAIVNSSQGVQTKILKLRNPWGSFEWKGDWSDNSECWTDQAKKQVGLTTADDGSFWIDYEEFRQYYDQISICEINDNYVFSCMNQGLNFKNGLEYRILKVNISNSGQYTFGISQKDKRCCQKDNGYEYQGVRSIFVKPNNGNIIQGLQFIKSQKSSWERDTYAKLENLQKGTYYILIHPELNECTYVDQPEFNINAYGPSNVTFSDETQSLKSQGFNLQDFVENQILSRLQQDPKKFEREDFSQDDAPNIKSYLQDIDDGYYYYIIENKESQKTLNLDCTWELSEKMKILPSSQNCSNRLKIQEGNVVHIEATPGSIVVNILQVPFSDGYSSQQQLSYTIS